MKRYIVWLHIFYLRKMRWCEGWETSLGKTWYVCIFPKSFKHRNLFFRYWKNTFNGISAFSLESYL